MPRATRWVALSALTTLLACEGPTLDVGARFVSEDDAGELDAGASPIDGGDDAGRIRDANFGDRDPHLEERRPCFRESDCFLNIYREHCSPLRAVCVECNDDRQCESGKCFENDGYCKPVDHPHDPATTQP